MQAQLFHYNMELDQCLKILKSANTDAERMAGLMVVYIYN